MNSRDLLTEWTAVIRMCRFFTVDRHAAAHEALQHRRVREQRDRALGAAGGSVDRTVSREEQGAGARSQQGGQQVQSREQGREQSAGSRESAGAQGVSMQGESAIHREQLTASSAKP